MMDATTMLDRMTMSKLGVEVRDPALSVRKR